MPPVVHRYRDCEPAILMTVKNPRRDRNCGVSSLAAGAIVSQR
ncbi:MAG: hypothetical protein AAGF98_16610 [Cyanobacteria bacterium P01_H01_bin.153]